MANILLNNVSEDTNGSEISFPGGFGVLIVRGDSFGGGTVTIEGRSVNDPGARWGTLRDDGTTSVLAEYTDSTTAEIAALVVGLEIRATLTGATAPSNVYVEVL
ncbi:hypothetical protein KAR91_10605 [Candidatus Pacearchaeota archaeon]|nr:hypothetical protein [Candidatus Pacearchaeota archaeon]